MRRLDAVVLGTLIGAAACSQSGLDPQTGNEVSTFASDGTTQDSDDSESTTSGTDDGDSESTSSDSASDASTSTTSESASTGDTDSSTGGSTGEPELPDNACMVKDAYGDLGAVQDALGFFVQGAGQSVGVDVFVTDSAVEPFDVVIVQLHEDVAPFAGGPPGPGVYDIAALGGLGACGGLCVVLYGEAAFDADGFLGGEFEMRATAGTVTIDDVVWNPSVPTSSQVQGSVQNLVLEQVDDENAIVPGGCSVTIEGFTFDEQVTHVVTL